jgi:hypothetical protein
MGTSFVEYKGYGFWSRDSYLEGWLAALLEEMRKLPAAEPWQKALVEHWQIQAEIDGGCMSLDLDEFLSEQAKRDFVLSVAASALPRSAESSRRTGELFIALLSGQIKTTVSSPVDYL